MCSRQEKDPNADSRKQDLNSQIQLYLLKGKNTALFWDMYKTKHMRRPTGRHTAISSVTNARVKENTGLTYTRE